MHRGWVVSKLLRHDGSLANSFIVTFLFCSKRKSDGGTAASSDAGGVSKKAKARAEDTKAASADSHTVHVSATDALSAAETRRQQKRQSASKRLGVAEKRRASTGGRPGSAEKKRKPKTEQPSTTTPRMVTSEEERRPAKKAKQTKAGKRRSGQGSK